MLTTLGCPFWISNSGTLLLWAVLFLGPSGAYNSAHFFVQMAPFYLHQRGNIQSISSLSSLSAMVIKVNRGCSCYGEVSEPELPKFLRSGIPIRRISEVRNSENPGRTTPKPGKPKLLNSGIPKPLFLWYLPSPLPPVQSNS